MTTSLDLSDKTLLFVKNHPLMEGVVTPTTGKPLLLRTGTRFSKIVVDQVTSLDGRQHRVLLIGTGMRLACADTSVYTNVNHTRGVNSVLASLLSLRLWLAAEGGEV